VSSCTCGAHALAAHLADLGELLGFRRHLADVVQHDRLGDVLHQVEDVVHPRDQQVDLVAIERRDERLVQQRDRLVRDLVRRALVAVDVLGVQLQLGEVRHHRRQARGCLRRSCRRGR
jgi:hypothetical protein